MTAPFEVGASLAGIDDADGSPQIIKVDGAGKGSGHFGVSKALADAAARSNGEGAEGALSQGDVVVGHGLAVQGVDFTSQPSLGSVAKGNGIAVLIVVNGIMGSTDNDALRKGVAINGHAAGEDLTGQNASDRGGETHGFVDAGAQVGA